MKKNDFVLWHILHVKGQFKFSAIILKMLFLLPRTRSVSEAIFLRRTVSLCHKKQSRQYKNAGPHYTYELDEYEEVQNALSGVIFTATLHRVNLRASISPPDRQRYRFPLYICINPKIFGQQISKIFELVRSLRGNTNEYSRRKKGRTFGFQALIFTPWRSCTRFQPMRSRIRFTHSVQLS